jgi:hypothetical protein
MCAQRAATRTATKLLALGERDDRVGDRSAPRKWCGCVADRCDVARAIAYEVRCHLEARLAAEVTGDELLTLSHAALPVVIKA